MSPTLTYLLHQIVINSTYTSHHQELWITTKLKNMIQVKFIILLSCLTNYIRHFILSTTIYTIFIDMDLLNHVSTWQYLFKYDKTSRIKNAKAFLCPIHWYCMSRHLSLKKYSKQDWKLKYCNGIKYWFTIHQQKFSSFFCLLSIEMNHEQGHT